MSVYHSIRGPVQAVTADEDGMFIVNINASEMETIDPIHPASERESGQVSRLTINNKCYLQ